MGAGLDICAQGRTKLPRPAPLGSAGAGAGACAGAPAPAAPEEELLGLLPAPPEAWPAEPGLGDEEHPTGLGLGATAGSGRSRTGSGAAAAAASASSAPAPAAPSGGGLAVGGGVASWLFGGDGAPQQSEGSAHAEPQWEGEERPPCAGRPPALAAAAEEESLWKQLSRQAFGAARDSGPRAEDGAAAREAEQADRGHPAEGAAEARSAADTLPENGFDGGDSDSESGKGGDGAEEHDAELTVEVPRPSPTTSPRGAHQPRRQGRMAGGPDAGRPSLAQQELSERLQRQRWRAEHDGATVLGHLGRPSAHGPPQLEPALARRFTVQQTKIVAGDASMVEHVAAAVKKRRQSVQSIPIVDMGLAERFAKQRAKEEAGSVPNTPHPTGSARVGVA